MAVGAKEAQVLDTVVTPVTVDTVDLKGQRFPLPHRLDPAQGTTLFHAAFEHRPLETIALDTPGVSGRLLDEQAF
jgi:hypothetical protein